MKKKTRKVRKLFAVVLAMAMVLTSVVWPNAEKASAATTLPGSGLFAVKILTATANKLLSKKPADETDKSLDIQENVNAEISAAKYLELAFVADLDSAQDTDKLFTLTAKNTDGTAGTPVEITKQDVKKNNNSGQYVAHVALQALKDSITGSLASVALSFVQEEPEITLKAYNALRDGATDEERVTVTGATMGTGDGHVTMQEFSLKDLQSVDSNITYSKVKSTQVKVYLHVKKSTNYTRLKVRGGNISTNSYSNKELVGKDCTTKSTNNSPFYIHLGYRTSGGYGSGMGVKGSGNY